MPLAPKGRGGAPSKMAVLPFCRRICWSKRMDSAIARNDDLLSLSARGEDTIDY